MSTFYVTKTGMTIDPSLIKPSGMSLFEPFYAESSHPLSKALAVGEIRPHEAVIVAEMADGKPITLMTKQMAYHHLAQGMSGDTSWMVVF